MSDIEFVKDSFEHGIKARFIPGLWRGPMTQKAAEDWVKKWIEDTDPEKQEALLGMFYTVRRPVGEWERYD